MTRGESAAIRYVARVVGLEPARFVRASLWESSSVAVHVLEHGWSDQGIVSWGTRGGDSFNRLAVLTTAKPCDPERCYFGIRFEANLTMKLLRKCDTLMGRTTTLAAPPFPSTSGGRSVINVARSHSIDFAGAA